MILPVKKRKERKKEEKRKTFKIINTIKSDNARGYLRAILE
jgi:hypothetical protein